MPLEKCFHCGGDMRPGEDKTCTGRAIHADDDICEIYREQSKADRDAKLIDEATVEIHNRYRYRKWFVSLGFTGENFILYTKGRIPKSDRVPTVWNGYPLLVRKIGRISQIESVGIGRNRK